QGDSVCLAHELFVEAKVEKLDREIGRAEMTFGPKAWARLPAGAPGRVSLVPYSRVPPDPIPDAICAVAIAWRERRPLPAALDDFLHRRPPRIRGHAGGPLLRPAEDLLEGAVRLVRDLDRSCLVIQGPPGSGKTTTAAHV